MKMCDLQQLELAIHAIKTAFRTKELFYKKYNDKILIQDILLFLFIRRLQIP